MYEDTFELYAMRKGERNFKKIGEVYTKELAEAVLSSNKFLAGYALVDGVLKVHRNLEILVS